MKKIYIKHLPRIYEITLIVTGAIMMLVCLEDSYAGTEKTTIIFLVFTFLFFIIAAVGADAKTTAEFGEGSVIKCRWLFVKWNIDIEKIRGAAYSLQRQNSRLGVRYIFELRFYSEGKIKPDIITEKLLPDEAEYCIKGNYDKVQLMQVYRYIEEYYPDKAIGYEKEKI